MAPGSAEPYGREGLPLETACRKVLLSLDGMTAPATEPCRLDQALGRVCGKDVHATEAVPGFRASIMDGYALGQNSQPHVDDQWTLKGRSAPGAPFEGTLQHGEAVRILTGAPLPEGAGWVLPQEMVQTDDHTQTLRLIKPASDQAWIRAEDEECRPGDQLIAAGTRLSSAALGRLSGCGVAHLAVYRSPRIGLLITGDELVPSHAQRPPGAIWESNGTLLEAVLSKLDQTIHDRRVIADEPSRLKDALQDMADRCDVVVSTGGVSAGDSDWIRTVVDDIGDISFWKLFLKPGRPFAFGQLKGNVPFFGLPGNPVAAAVTALQLLWPALQRLEGQAEPERFPRVKVRLAHPLQRRAGRPELARGRLLCNADGDLLAEIKGSQASSRIGSLDNADLLLELPAEASSLEAGHELWAQLIRRAVF